MRDKPVVWCPESGGTTVVHLVATSLAHYLLGEPPHRCEAPWTRQGDVLEAECPHARYRQAAPDRGEGTT